MQGQSTTLFSPKTRFPVLFICHSSREDDVKLDKEFRLEHEGRTLRLLVATELEVLATLDGKLGPGLRTGGQPSEDKDGGGQRIAPCTSRTPT